MPIINEILKEDVELFSTKSTFEEYQRISTKSALYPGQGEALGLMYVALKLNGEAGELAEHVGKALRDDGYSFTNPELTAERKNLIIKEIGDCLWYLSAICNELDYKLPDAALENLVKLQSRTERSKLQGSGDER